MKRRTFIRNTSATGLITLISPPNIIPSFNNETASILEENFSRPPLSASPQTLWFWMNGNVTKDGITLDLEAMKRVGIGGVLNFDVGTGIPKGPVKYLGEEWLQLKKHAINEANRLDLEFIMHNCPGWSSSGGPWITPKLAMQQITWSETYVSGGKQINISLPKPANRLEHYQDIAVIAYPSLEGEELLQTVVYSSSSGPVDKKLLIGKDPQGAIVHPAKDLKAWLQLEFAEPYEARLLTFFISAIATADTKTIPLDFGDATAIELEASDDGVLFRNVVRINTGLETELLLGDKFIVFDIPITKAKYFRFTSAKSRRYKQVQFSGISRLRNWMEKTNQRGRSFVYVPEASTVQTINNQPAPSGSIIDPRAILDISKHADNDGILNWNAPAGNWTILRIGFTPSGTLNKAAPDTGIGLECDKYNAEAITFHFNKMMEHLLPSIKQLAEKKKIGLEIDSYEAGGQNWTAGFESEFRKRWGYEIIKYLSVLAGGRIVGSIDITERFLWDFRRLQADMIAENYYGRFRELCHQHGITTYVEPYESGPMEEMQIGSKADINLGEFWNGFPSVVPAKTPVLRTPKLVASIAHINGQKVIGAEAFTSEPDSSRWQEYPFALKALGDKIFTRGVNRMVIHRYAHQPHPSASPGMTMGPWGIHFDRTNTWWNQSKAWVTYLSRCQYLLQQGVFVADLLYFSGEDANMYTKVNPDDLNPSVPEGYDYDMINAETILKQMKIANNEIVLHHGMNYKIFVLQNFKAITLTLLRKLRDLVKQGMILVGEKPERSAGLADYANGDAEFTQITNELWGNNKDNIENKIGNGSVFWGTPLSFVLQKQNIKPDFEFTSASGDAPVLYTHRKIQNADVYFLSNQRRKYEQLVCTFRVKNKQPELWEPSSGKTIPAAIYELIDDRVRMPVQLEPCGSIFIVFRNQASSNRLHSISNDGEVVLTTKNFIHSSRELYSEIANNFTIGLWAKPEINILLNPAFTMGTIVQPWTDYYAIYPPAGSELYGPGHATCGVTVGRNGVAVLENASGSPVLVLAAAVPISGWSHVAITYEEGAPSIFLNGKFVLKGEKKNNIIHPAIDKVYLKEGASYYNGDMSKPKLFTEVLGEDRIVALAAELPPLQVSPFSIEMTGGNKPALLIKQNGNYSMHASNAKISSFKVSDIEKPLEIKGPWQANFPASSGAPSQIILSELISLHKHGQDEVKYFSGTAVYSKEFTLSAKSLGGKRWIIDLGKVEVIAELNVNGKDLGILWKRPYQADITNALKPGENRLEIKVTNTWPNRLIGDEQLPDPDKFTPGANTSGREALIGGGIEKLPDWFIHGQAKPANGRVGFATWKHYLKSSPLLESGLIGPLIIFQAVIKQL